MTLKRVLITGCNGEVGQALLDYFLAGQKASVTAVDLQGVPANSAAGFSYVSGDITDSALWERLDSAGPFDAIFHLAALLSSASERDPFLAHRVNAEGSLNVFKFAQRQSELRGERTIVMFTSTIAVYGIPTLAAKNAAKDVSENDYLSPKTIYGACKLHVERLGDYFSSHYGLLSSVPKALIDFRALRYPALISSDTLPTGGTSDYGPEMVHAAAKGMPYECFVRPDTTLPFMAMPDAISALTKLFETPRSGLRRSVYNVSSFSISAGELAETVKRSFPDFSVSFAPHTVRQSIVDSWPADVCDAAARADWGWSPRYDFKEAFLSYLIPGVQKRYRQLSPNPSLAAGGGAQ